MLNLNEVNLIGYVGNDPEVKMKGDEIQLVKLSVATSEKWKNAQGEEVKSTQWHNCTAFKGTARIISKYVQKGSAIYIKGKIKYSKVEKEGQEIKYFTDITIVSVIILSKSEDLSNNNPENSSITTDNIKSQTDSSTKTNGNDLPF